MSLDLSWDLLDETFAAGLVEKLNKILTTTQRPDYLGPISLSSLNIGSEPPEVGIVDVGDVWPAFLQQEDGLRNQESGNTANTASDAQRARSSSHGHPQGPFSDGLQHKRIVSAPPQHSSLMRFANQNLPFASMSRDDVDDDSNFDRRGQIQGGPSQEEAAMMHKQQRGRKRDAHQFKSYRQYSDSGRLHRIDTGSMASGYNGSVTPWSTATPGLGWGSGSQAGYFSAWPGAPLPSHGMPENVLDGQDHLSPPQLSRASSWHRQNSFSPVTRIQQMGRRAGTDSYMTWDDANRSHMEIPYDKSPPDEPAEQSSTLPSLQLHLSLSWTTQSLRLTLNTCLLINHPSPAFMSLPLTITITGLAMQAGALLAFEVDQVTNVRRAHFCLTVDDDESLDASSFSGDISMRSAHNIDSQTESGLSARAASSRALGLSSVPHISGASYVQARRNIHPNSFNSPHLGGVGLDGMPTLGERILSGVNLETSVGQTDKHVLKNVAKVERFVVTLVRKAITDELVFPNFYSIELSS